jgi:hypothetical protein
MVKQQVNTIPRKGATGYHHAKCALNLHKFTLLILPILAVSDLNVQQKVGQVPGLTLPPRCTGYPLKRPLCKANTPISPWSPINHYTLFTNVNYIGGRSIGIGSAVLT